MNDKVGTEPNDWTAVTTTEATDDTDDGDEYFARIVCGCGFEAVGGDEGNNRYAYQAHIEEGCPNVPSRWYQHVFGFWTWAIAGTLGAVAAHIFGGGR